MQRIAGTGLVFRVIRDVASTRTAKSSSDVEEPVLKNERNGESSVGNDQDGRQCRSNPVPK